MNRFLIFVFSILLISSTPLVLESSVLNEENDDSAVLIIKSNPEGATVLIDGKEIDIKTPCTINDFPLGEHKLGIQLDLFHDYEEILKAEKNDTIELDIDLMATYGTLEISTNPNSEIFINNELKGDSLLNIKLTPGNYSIEARKFGHISDKKDIELAENETKKIALSPTPVYGYLTTSMNSTNYNISFFEESLICENTDSTYKMLAGEYEVEISKKWAIPITKKIKIQENDTVYITENFTTTTKVKISSQPLGIPIFIDGKDMGLTPFEGELNFGNHNLKIISNTRVFGKQITLLPEGGKTEFEYDLHDHIRFIDKRDKTTYTWTQIGEQIWMAENLNYETKENSWCYEDKKKNCKTYGRLYSFYIADEVCPQGWRLPSKEDFDILLKTVGEDGSNIYHALKDYGSSGFSSKAYGWRDLDGVYKDFDNFGNYWSSTQFDGYTAYYLNISDAFLHARVFDYFKELGFSVRCIKEE